MRTCPNGHAVPDTAAFCPACGAPAPMAPQPASQPGIQPAVHPGFPAGPTSAPEAARKSGNRHWVILGIAVGAIVILGLLIAVLVTGSKQTAPLTSAAARDALLSAPGLEVPLTESTEPDSLETTDAFAPDTTPACTTILGVTRLTDIDPGTDLGTPVFPSEVRDIDVFEGVNFKDTSEDLVSSVRECIIVFPTEEDAASYIAEVGAATEACPSAVLSTSVDTLTMTSTKDLADVQVTDTEVSWNARGTFVSDDSDGILDFTFDSDEGALLVQRGPNVLVVTYYKDSSDPASLADFQATLDNAKSSFIAATG